MDIDGWILIVVVGSFLILTLLNRKSGFFLDGIASMQFYIDKPKVRISSGCIHRSVDVLQGSCINVHGLLFLGQFRPLRACASPRFLTDGMMCCRKTNHL